MLCIHICSAFYSVCLCLSVCLSVKVNMVFDIEFIFCFELFARALDVKKTTTTKTGIVLTITCSITLVNSKIKIKTFVRPFVR